MRRQRQRSVFGSGASRRGTWASAWTVYRKEIVDALRDRRTLATVLVSSVLLGPLVLLALSQVLASLEARAERRELVVATPADAPTLVNFLERQSFRVRAAPADYEARLRDASLGDAVIVVPRDFETGLRQGDAPRVEIVSDSANGRSQANAGQAARLLGAFARERATLTLALRGVSPDAIEAVRIDERDLASTQTRAVQWTGALPFFVLMAVLTGALTAALDTTAGERERGSLEPLLMNPPTPLALVVGKWAAVASVAILIAALASASFIPAQALLRSDTLAAMFSYGPREAAQFLLVLLPFAAAAAALLMAVAIRCRSFKEAQASTAVVMLAASGLPLVNLFSLGQESPWFVWVPALAQNVLMTHVLKGDGLALRDYAPSFLVCLSVTAASLAFVARGLRGAAVR